MGFDKEFLAADKVGQMTEYIMGKPKNDEGEGIAGFIYLGRWNTRNP